MLLLRRLNKETIWRLAWLDPICGILELVLILIGAFFCSILEKMQYDEFLEFLQGLQVLWKNIWKTKSWQFYKEVLRSTHEYIEGGLILFTKRLGKNCHNRNSMSLHTASYERVIWTGLLMQICTALNLKGAFIIFEDKLA